MSIKIAAIGAGLAAILGAGSVLLSIVGNASWVTFLAAAILVFIFGKIFLKM